MLRAIVYAIVAIVVFVLSIPFMLRVFRGAAGTVDNDIADNGDEETPAQEDDENQ